QLGDPGRHIPEKPVHLLPGRPINDVVTSFQFSQHAGDFFGWRLQIVVHRDDDFVLGGADTTKQCVVLAVIPHQVETADPRILLREVLDNLPTAVPAAVIDQDELAQMTMRLQCTAQTLNQQGQAPFRVVYRDDYRYQHSSIIASERNSKVTALVYI